MDQDAYAVARDETVRLLPRTPNQIVSADFGQFRDVLNAHFYPARVEPVGDRGVTAAPHLSAVVLPHMTVGRVRFGADAAVDPGDIVGYHVNVPLSGRIVSRRGEDEAVATPATAAVFSPHQHTDLPFWAAGRRRLRPGLHEPRPVRPCVPGPLRPVAVEHSRSRGGRATYGLTNSRPKCESVLLLAGSEVEGS
jgi:hypothetical protein